MAVGCNPKIARIMKRYLYILLAAVLTLVSCEPAGNVSKTPDVAFCFSKVSVETGEHSATITAVKPYMTLNGVKHDDVTISLEYIQHQGDLMECATEYAEQDGDIVFEIDNLTSGATYDAYIVVDGGEYGKEKSSPFTFTTQKSVPTCRAECRVEVLAKGVTATLNISNVVYFVDDVEQDVEKVTLQVSPSIYPPEWEVIELNYSDNISVTLPVNGDAYLEEKEGYSYIVIVTPADDTLAELIAVEGSFETATADVRADFSGFDAAIQGDNLYLSVESVKVYFDDIQLAEYCYLDYGFIYRKYGDEQWSSLVKTEYQEETISWSMPLSNFEPGATYEFCAAVEAGVEHKVLKSDVKEISIPDDEPVTPPTPPVPPVSGDADTSDIAGVWHLTEWRGAEPGFDVYLSITEDGVVSLFQRIESRLWETFFSTVSYENGVIAGVYTDGVAWAQAYKVAIDGDIMTWTSTTDSRDVSVYTRSQLPDVTNPEIRTMSASDKRFL